MVARGAAGRVAAVVHRSRSAAGCAAPRASSAARCSKTAVSASSAIRFPPARSASSFQVPAQSRAQLLGALARVGCAHVAQLDDAAVGARVRDRLATPVTAAAHGHAGLHEHQPVRAVVDALGGASLGRPAFLPEMVRAALAVRDVGPTANSRCIRGAVEASVLRRSRRKRSRRRLPLDRRRHPYPAPPSVRPAPPPAPPALVPAPPPRPAAAPPFDPPPPD